MRTFLSKQLSVKILRPQKVHSRVDKDKTNDYNYNMNFDTTKFWGKLNYY
jgi:hypothetical protein